MPTNHRHRRRWSDLDPREQALVIGLAAVQVGLATAAWIDLARRPAAAIRGPKAAWAVGIGVNFAGPIAYFAIGRRRAISAGT